MRKVRTMEKRTYLEDLTEEEIRAMDNDPEFQKEFKEMTRIAKERQWRLRQAERSSSPSEKKT